MQFIVNFASAGTASALAAFVDNSLSYDPSTQGDISSLAASVQHDYTASNFYSPTSGPGSLSFVSGALPLIVQDGTIYIYSFLPGPNLNFSFNGTTPAGGTTGYVTVSGAGLTAANFDSLDLSTNTIGTAHPNFSGDTMQFGLLEFDSLNFTNATNASVTFESDFDALKYDITPTPEPSTLLLLGMGLLAVGILSRGKLEAIGRAR